MTLKELRNSKGFTQKEAAEFLNIPLRTYKRYEIDSSHSDSIKYKAIFKELENTESRSINDKPLFKPTIVIFGAGYVGFNTGLLLSNNSNIIFIDINKEKVVQLRNNGYVAYESINSVKRIDIGIICIPTDFNEKTNDFETTQLNNIALSIINKNKNALIVIKSTVNIGYTRSLQELINHPVYFSPEFLREKHAKDDSFYPIRLIIGGDRKSQGIRNYAILVEASIRNRRKTIFMSLEEAEATKLYSNAYLAMRVTFFNELDTLAVKENLDSSKIINALSLDSRIGSTYNNPSFCYSGYCLPKDTKVLSNRTNSMLLKSVIDSNEQRKSFVANEIIKEASKIHEHATIGVYLPDNNLRESSTKEIIRKLEKYPGKVVVFNSKLGENKDDFDRFVNESDLIVSEYSIDEKLLKNKKLFIRSLVK